VFPALSVALINIIVVEKIIFCYCLIPMKLFIAVEKQDLSLLRINEIEKNSQKNIKR